MRLIKLLSIVMLLLCSAGFSFAVTGHPGDPNSHPWMIDGVQLGLTITEKNDNAVITVSARYQNGNQAVLDADLAVAITATGQHDQMLMDMERPATLSFDAPPVVAPAVNFLALVPAGKSGEYTVSLPLKKGQHLLRLSVGALDRHRYVEPVILATEIHYPTKEGAMGRHLTVIFIFVSTMLTVFGYVVARHKSKTSPDARLNLLDVGWVGGLYRWSWFPSVLQIPMVIVTVLILFSAFWGPSQGDKNLATIGVWTIWWAGVIFTFVFFARSWCLICPLGALQDWIQRIVTPLRRYPKRLRNLWLTTTVFVLLTWFNSFSGLVNRPLLTAAILLFLALVAIISALLFKGRVFCRYLCPIGGVIGIYSMTSPLRLRPQSAATCQSPHRKDCLIGTDRSLPCPMFENVPKLDKNAYCNLCGECVKGCQRNNLKLEFANFGEDLWRTDQRRMDEAILATIMVGLALVVTAEMVAPWHGWLDSFIRVTGLSALSDGNHAFVEKIAASVVLLVGAVTPAVLLWGISVWSRKRLELPREETRNLFVRFAYMFIPVGLATHLAHNVSHLFNEGGQIVVAGQVELQRIGLLDNSRMPLTGSPLLGAESLYWLQMLIVIMLGALSLLAGYRISARYYRERTLTAYFPMALLSVCFILLTLIVLMQPMALRHSH